MHIAVRLFASYREAAGTGRLQLDLPLGSTARDAVEAVTALHPVLVGSAKALVARNLDYVESDAPLADGDEIALIPPVSGGSGGRVRVSDGTLSVDDAMEAVRSPKRGGLVLFIGTVREQNRGRAVEHLEYEAYPEMAEAKLGELADRLEGVHGARLALHHRTGDLAIGEIAVIVAASAEHRDAAFDAARAAIEELKRTVPIWKKEHFADGSVWLEDHP